MSNQDHDDEDSDYRGGKERRHQSRRAADIVDADDLTVSDFRLSLKEVGFILGVLITVATALFNFHNQLEKTNAENVLKFELLNTKLSQIQTDMARFDKTQEALREQLSDMERLTSQIYQRTKDK